MTFDFPLFEELVSIDQSSIVPFSDYTIQRKPLEEKLILFQQGQKFGQVVFLAGGAGCLSKGTKVLLYSGKTKAVEDVVAGDTLVGPSGEPNRVVRLLRGVEEMLRVETTTKDLSYECNISHIHSFRCSYSKNGLVAGKIYNMTYKEWLELSATKQKALKIYRSESIEFESKDIEFDPWMVGVFLGDGCVGNMTISTMDDAVVRKLHEVTKNTSLRVRQLSRGISSNCDHYSLTTEKNGAGTNPFRTFARRELVDDGGNKRIPKAYLLNSRDIRRKLLAGLIDSDGYYQTGCYEIVTKFSPLKTDIVFLCGSLGYRATVSEKIVEIAEGRTGIYYRITISGNFEDLAPHISLERKKPAPRTINKNPCNYGYTIHELDAAEYFGFSLENEDRRFVLGNFIVTHNSGKGFVLKNFIEGEKFKVRDVDEWKREFMKLDRIASEVSKKNAVASKQHGISTRKAAARAISTMKVAGKDTSLFVQQKIDQIDARKLNLRKANDVFRLHLLVKSLGIKNKTLNLLLGNSTHKDRLPNILFDSTLKDLDDITEIIPKLINVGYNPKNIHLEWVLASFHVAVRANKERARVVPDDIILATHSGAAMNMTEIILGKIPRGLNGRIDIVLNNRENTIPWTDADGKVIKRRGNIIVKSFTSLNIKAEGKPPNTEKKVLAQAFEWMKKNIPKKAALQQFIDKKEREFTQSATKNADSVQGRAV